MGIWCQSCKSWNCEGNGYGVMCYKIVEQMLLTKLPQELIKDIIIDYKYEGERLKDLERKLEAKRREEENLVECIKCHIRREAPEHHLLCSKCYSEFGYRHLATKGKKIKEFINPSLLQGKCLI